MPWQSKERKKCFTKRTSYPIGSARKQFFHITEEKRQDMIKDKGIKTLKLRLGNVQTPIIIIIVMNNLF